jgi:hypothetical protein
MLVSSPLVKRDANDAHLELLALSQERVSAKPVVVARRPTRPAPSASSACRATSRLMMVNANSVLSPKSLPATDRASAIRADLHHSRMSTKPRVPCAQPVHSPTTTVSASHASLAQFRRPEQQSVSSVHVALRPTLFKPSVCTATLASSRRLIRNVNNAHWIRSRPDSVHASVTNALPVHSPTLQ